MKYCFHFYLSCFFSISLSAQPLVKKQMPVTGKGNTYAVIVGVAKYLDPNVPQLEFSNRDARIFADFLMSASGGSVPKENIKLLIDYDATEGEISDAIVKLKDKCNKDDNVFFYFSGHGALENETMYNNGFLICYNTSYTAFKNMGLSIGWLNEMANTLSVEKNVNVIMITDACHSGRMADKKFKGNILAGMQLLKSKEQEIRISSCKPEEVSIEKTDWGGGRGVFSYHLVNGLMGGFADADKNGFVTLGEISSYLGNAMANDQGLKNDGKEQTPVIKGRPDFTLSTVVESDVVNIKKIVEEDSVANTNLINALNAAAAEGPADPEEYFFSLLKKEDLEWLTEDLKLDSLATDAIAFALINKLEKRPLNESQLSKLKDLTSQLKNDPEKLTQFNGTLARCINDKGQNIILQYINGDEAELERRRYYNIYSSGYDIYPKMFAAALKLSGDDAYFSTRSAVFLHYFTGVTLRLKIPITANPKPLIEQALAEQKKALALEEYAAYIYNELGILYHYKKEYTKAEKYFIKATQLSPGWALPQSNLCGLYGATGKYNKAMAACHIADSLHFAPDSLKAGLQSVSINRGFISEKKGNFLFAEEYYHHAIEINARHFLPFERLGFVNLNTTNYALADSLFYEADLRKKGFHFLENDWNRISVDAAPAFQEAAHCPVNPSILLPTDIFAFFTWGVQEYKARNYTEAVSILKKIIALDKNNPLVFHYLGKIFYDLQQWEEAELMFTYAMKYALGKEDFEHYADSVKRSVAYKYKHDCFEQFFEQHYYDKIEDYFFFGTIYENWKHLEEAEQYFKTIIKLQPQDIGGYLKLWQLYEHQGRYAEAEQVIMAYVPADKERSETELNAFYRRTIEKFKDDGNDDANMCYRLGILLYNRASLPAKAAYLDSIVWFPLLNKEQFIDLDLYDKLDSNYELSLSDRFVTGSPGMIVVNKSIVKPVDLYIIPGTGELIPQAPDIYLPRKDGISYLKKAGELLSEKETLADINFKIGNIYLWAGSKKQAHPYFEKSLAFVPDNANARLTLIDIYTALHKNSAALDQLNYLYDSSQINLEKRMLLAQFNIHAGQFDKAKTLLNKAEAIYPYTVPEIANLRGRLNLLNNKTKEAISFYKNYMVLDSEIQEPGFTEIKTIHGVDSTFTYVQIDNRRIPAYTLARLYARTGKADEALKWLETAINYGFNYAFVLQLDPLMDKLRKTKKWRTLVSSISAKTYASNFTAN